MNIDSVRAFLSIIDTGSMTAAASQLRLTQPALSRTIKNLEQEFSCALFERTGRGLLLSSSGRAFEPEARRILAHVEDALTRMQRVARRKFFDIRIGTVDSVLGVAIPNVVSDLRVGYPGIELKIHADRSNLLMERLARGEIDFAITATPPGSPGEFLHAEIAPYDLYFYGRRDCFPELPMAQTEADLARFPLIKLASIDTSPSCTVASATFAMTNNFATAKALVMAGFGVGSLVQFYLTADEEAQLVRSGYSNRDEACTLKLWWRKDRNDASLNEISTKLAASLRKTFEDRCPSSLPYCNH